MPMRAQSNAVKAVLDRRRDWSSDVRLNDRAELVGRVGGCGIEMSFSVRPQSMEARKLELARNTIRMRRFGEGRGRG